MNRIFFIGLLAALLGVICNLSFLIYTIRYKITNGISYHWISLVITTDLLWIWYNIEIKSLPLIISNILSLIILISVLLLKIIYEKKKIASHFKKKNCGCLESCPCDHDLDK
jgi:MtN3 and saliva related transmembrane protein